MFAWVRARLPSLRRPLWQLFLALAALNTVYFILGVCEGIFHFTTAVGWGAVAIERFQPTVPQKYAAGLLADVSELTVQPVGVPKLLSPLEWWDRLGMVRVDPDPRGDGTSYRNIYRPSSLYRRVGRREARGQWHHWVYLSPGNGTDTNVSNKQWDDAFDELIQYHNVHPAANRAKFHYLSCGGGDLLCRLWLIRGPALVHFTTESPSGGEMRGETKNGWKYDLVNMRIMEFPLATKALHLLPGVFPSPFDQLRSLTESPDAWKLWRPQGPLERAMGLARWTSHVKALEYPWTFGPLYWLDQSLPREISSNFFVTPMYLVGWAGTISAQLIWRFGMTHFVDAMYELFPRLPGRSTSGDSASASKESSEARMKTLEDVVVTFFSCTAGDVRKLREIPEVSETMDRLQEFLSKESREAIEAGDPALQRYCQKREENPGLTLQK